MSRKLHAAARAHWARVRKHQWTLSSLLVFVHTMLQRYHATIRPPRAAAEEEAEEEVEEEEEEDSNFASQNVVEEEEEEEEEEGMPASPASSMGGRRREGCGVRPGGPRSLASGLVSRPLGTPSWKSPALGSPPGTKETGLRGVRAERRRGEAILWVGTGSQGFKREHWWWVLLGSEGACGGGWGVARH